MPWACELSLSEAKQPVTALPAPAEIQFRRISPPTAVRCSVTRAWRSHPDRRMDQMTIHRLRGENTYQLAGPTEKSEHIPQMTEYRGIAQTSYRGRIFLSKVIEP